MSLIQESTDRLPPRPLHLEQEFVKTPSSNFRTDTTDALSNRETSKLRIACYWELYENSKRSNSDIVFVVRLSSEDITVLSS